MKICIIYHSESGNTRHVAQHLASACYGHLIEVCDRATYSRLTRFLLWCKKARAEEKTDIEPATIDVSEFDLLVFGSPVWAFKPTPVIHAAIDALIGCSGKPAVAFSTHGGRPGQTDEAFKRWIESSGMRFIASTAIHQKDIENEKITKDIVSLITSIKNRPI
jgi:flavodoxin